VSGRTSQGDVTLQGVDTADQELELLESEASRLWWAAACCGNLEAAWQQSDRLRSSGQIRENLPRYFRPLWGGAPIKDCPVVVRCWRGLGDAIHHVRYIPLLQNSASSVWLEASAELVPLFNCLNVDRLFPLDTGQNFPPDVVEIEVTELPYVFRTTLKSIPSRVPYLSLPASGRQRRSSEKLAVGLCWSGGTYDPRRALSPEDLLPLAEITDVTWVQLQRGRPANEYRFLPFMNLKQQSMAILETAELIEQLDLVVTVDTMIAHLAGALAKPVWTLLHADPDWRWFRDRSDSPWYPTMRLFRQTSPGVWSDVVESVAQSLRRLHNSSLLSQGLT
jgi:Glycosyltransferase family 9 (heptosyltransferase)